MRRRHDVWSGATSPDESDLSGATSPDESDLSGATSPDESDLHVGPALDEVAPGSGDAWRDLWERDTQPTDQDTWDAFFAGDTGKRREVDWLLSA